MAWHELQNDSPKTLAPFFSARSSVGTLGAASRDARYGVLCAIRKAERSRMSSSGNWKFGMVAELA